MHVRDAQNPEHFGIVFSGCGRERADMAVLSSGGSSFNRCRRCGMPVVLEGRQGSSDPLLDMIPMPASIEAAQYCPKCQATAEIAASDYVPPVPAPDNRKKDVNYLSRTRTSDEILAEAYRKSRRPK